MSMLKHLLATAALLFLGLLSHVPAFCVAGMVALELIVEDAK